MKHVIRPAAKDDILRQFRYYLLADAFETATRFLESVDRSIEMICTTPEIGAPKQIKNALLVGLRSWPVEDFEDIHIYYLLRENVLRVVRLLHGKRDIARILRKEGKT